MPDIMSSMLFQNSRRQLLAYLIHACDAASSHQNQHFGEETLEQGVQERWVRSLSSAVRSAEEQVKSLEYWSDVKNVTGLKEGHETADQCHECSPVESGGSNGKEATKVSMPEVRDVSDEADERRDREDFSEEAKETERSDKLDKGKARE